MLSFGVFDSFLITKAIQDWGEFYRIHGKANGSSFTWWTQDLKWHIVWIKWTLGSAQNVFNICYPLEFLHVRLLSLFFLLAFMICFWQRTIKLQRLDSSCKWASNFFAMDSIELSSILDCFGDKKSYQKHQNLTQFD